MTHTMAEAQWQEVKRLVSEHLGDDRQVRRTLDGRIRAATVGKFCALPHPDESTADFVCRVLFDATQKAQADLKVAIDLPDVGGAIEQVACATIAHCDLLILYNLARAFANTQSLYTSAALFCGLLCSDKLLDVVTGVIERMSKKAVKSKAEGAWQHECVCDGVHVYTKTFSDDAECGKESEEAGEEPKAPPTDLDYLRAGTLTLAAYQEQAVKTAKYPDKWAVSCPVIGLNGAAGQLASALNRVVRENDGRVTDAFRKELHGKLGCVLWNLAAICRDLDIDLCDVAQRNLDKSCDKACDC